MKNKITSAVRNERWKGRPACTIENSRLSLSFLLGGGHLASLRFHSAAASGLNLLWEANWRTIDPQQYSERVHRRAYGPPPAAKYLAAYTGHVLCLDYFGSPSEEETKLGLPLHGEVASSRWSVKRKNATRGSAHLELRSAAKSSKLSIRRQIEILGHESVARVTETVTNLDKRDRFYQWVQHTTFGAPLLQAGESTCAVPGTSSKTWPLGYEGKAALENDREFRWPMAPSEGGGTHDLSTPFAREGRGFVVTTLLDQGCPIGYVAVLNWRLGLIAGYCFRRTDFPWVAVWEENRARSGAPWNGKSQARGLEFGTSPMPIGLRDTILAGPLFGVPTVRCLPARARQAASYLIFATEIPKSWRTIAGISTREDAIVITGPMPNDRIELPAKDIGGLMSLENAVIPTEPDSEPTKNLRVSSSSRRASRSASRASKRQGPRP